MNESNWGLNKGEGNEVSQVKLQYSIVQIVVTEIKTRILAENSCLCTENICLCTENSCLCTENSCLCTEKASLNAIAVAFVITQP